MAELTGERRWRRLARRPERALAAQAPLRETHDVGFMVFVPFARAYRVTGERRYLGTVLRAGRMLASRFDPQVGATRSCGARHNPRLTVIVATT